MPTGSEVNLNGFVIATVSLQFAFFGWRLAREIAVGDKEEKDRVWKTWLPWPDRVNLVSLGLVIATCIIAPIIMGRFTAVSQAVLAGAVILLWCHPLSLAFHYELFRGGRRVVYGGPENWPQVTASERKIVLGSVLLAVIAGTFAWFIVMR